MNETVTPIAARLTTYVRQDDNPPRNGAISAAVNPPDETIAKGVVYLDENKLSVEIDEAGLLALLNEALGDYAAHRASAVFHSPADTTNTVSTVTVTSIVVAIVRANLLKTALRAHMNNDGGSYHDSADSTNRTALGLVPDATDVQSLRTLVIAIKQYYNAHRTQSGVHPTNDTTNVISTGAPDVFDVQGPLTIGTLDATTLTAAALTSNSTVLNGPLVVESLEIDNTFDEFTLTYANSRYWVDGPTDPATVYTVDSSTTPPTDSEIEIAVFDIGALGSVDIQRTGGASIASFSGSAGNDAHWIKVKFVGGSWRLWGISSTETITFGTP